MTARTQPIIDDAKAASVRVIGHEDSDFIFEHLARQILGADACISTGYIRAGLPSTRPAKQPYRAVDEVPR